jgi:crossover junction endodeoxyribonuclease RuvC
LKQNFGKRTHHIRIDPGTTIMGFGLMLINKKMEFIQLNELLLSKYDNHYQKLKLIFERTIEL